MIYLTNRMGPNKIYGDYKIISENKESGFKQARYNCVCVLCGQQRTLSKGYLAGKPTCAICDGRKPKLPTFCEYSLNDEICNMIVTRGDEVYTVVLDAEDYTEVSKQKWYICLDKSNKVKYLYTYINNKIVTLISFILQTHGLHQPGLYCAYLNSNPLDNRKANLIQGSSPNTIMRKRPSNNTSGHRGVYYNKACSCWVASITTEHQYKFLGSFSTFQAAVKAREAAEQEHLTRLKQTALAGGH